MRKRLEFYLPSNHCHNLESQFCLYQSQAFGSYSAATKFNFSINTFDIVNSIVSPTKAPIMGYFLCCRDCCYTGIKILTFLPTIYTIIIERLWFISFQLAKVVKG